MDRQTPALFTRHTRHNPYRDHDQPRGKPMDDQMITKKQRNLLRSFCRDVRELAAIHELGPDMLVRPEKNQALNRTLAVMAPALIKESRELADAVDAIVEDGKWPPYDPWLRLLRRMQMCSAKYHALILETDGDTAEQRNEMSIEERNR